MAKIQIELAKKGITEKRGRPKKEEQRKKFTAHLQFSTIEYLQRLQSKALFISNISAFLVELVSKHEKRTVNDFAHCSVFGST